MIAHKRASDGREQSVSCHSYNTATLCAKSASKFGFEKLGFLAGILHDSGKCTELFCGYLRSQFDGQKITTSRGEIHHAPIGAIFAYERWYCGSRARQTAAQVLAMIIYGHHSGLMDAISIDGSSPLLEKLSRDKNELCYYEAVTNFLQEVCSEAELDNLFLQGVTEIERKKASLSDFNIGLLVRELLSCLVDADRWDSACFEYGENPLKEPLKPNWDAAYAALEHHLRKYPRNTPLSRMRWDISETCLNAADGSPGIYRLTVPTGGGKTFASLRFAVRHAAKTGMDRIFYVIPFNTILDQNSRDIREVLGNTVSVLEHHSNVVFDDETSFEEFENYKHLTERWETDIVLTSVVQFLNAFYRKENSAARRLCHLSRSVIIFDEIQALPKKCTRLFEKAVSFLVKICGCTIVLCTATQPHLELEYREIMPDTTGLYKALRRTQLIDELHIARSCERAATDILKLIEKHSAVLMVVNTKRIARRLYELVRSSGMPCICLSTDMYPAHRLKLIDRIKNRGEAPLFCISTALIEAGINISFPCVVRSLAGLGSVLQASGRCNRNAELLNGAMGEVYVWKLFEESLRGLPEIATAQGCTEGLLAAMNSEDASSPGGIAAYFEMERKAFYASEDFPAKADGIDVTLVELFGKNGMAPCSDARGRLRFYGAYRTAETIFRVIDSDTRPVLVAHGRGDEIATTLAGNLSMSDRIKLLREAQRYSVSLYLNVFNELVKENAIWRIENANVYVLRKEYYNDETGLSMEAQFMADLQF
ncbi:MAG: CRISPR-associated helicase Cas3' [Lentisphaerae bacterium]|nr:CRISPR-associated helicase Cas3' [Lentisphaerota bacterium]NLV51487.1 CRISPR-associated helicase Cas3' [Clostridiales bacterium]